jgi:ribose transport system ATP-binding protein
MISEDRKELGLFLNRPVSENIGIVQNEQSGMLLKLKEEFKQVSDMVEQLRIHLASITQDADSLSGGNQQKCVLGRWLMSDAEVYIFDEPTKGVDIGAKEEIYKIITDLARQGKMIIMVSSDMPELISMSDRIGVMRDGELVAIVPQEAATEQRLIKEYLGFSKSGEV